MVYTLSLICVPLLAGLIELFLWASKTSKRSQGIASIASAICCTVLSGFISFDHYTTKGLVSLESTIEWIPNLGMNFLIGVDTVSAMMLPVIFMAATYSLLTSKLKDEKDGPYFLSIMILLSAITGSILSRNLAVKVFLWELTWIPFLFNMLRERKQVLASHFSILWFFSEFLIIAGTLILSNKEIAFWLYVSGILIRSATLPFDSMLDRITKDLSSGLSSIMNILLPTLPFLFAAQVLVPSFRSELNSYGLYIAIALILIAALKLTKFIRHRTLYDVINTNITIYAALMMSCLMVLDRTMIMSALKICVMKTPLNILIISCGVAAIENGIKIKSINTWMLIVSLLLSFGIPGVTISGSFFDIISSWNYRTPVLGIIVLLTLSLLIFISTSILSKEMATSKNNTAYTNITLVIMAIIIFIASIALSTPRSMLSEISSNYYKSISGDLY